MAVGERRDLRQVGDHQDLGVLGEHGQPAADLDRRLAADAGVDLVEDERRHRVGRRQRHLDAEHHPGELTAGGALAQRLGLGADVGGQQQLDLVEPGGGEPHRAVAHRAARSASSAWVTATVSVACGIASWLSSSVTTLTEPVAATARAFGRAAPVVGQLERAASALRRLQLVDRPVGVVEVEEPGADVLADQASTSSIVSPYLRVSAVSAARRSGHGGQPGRVGLQAGGVRRHVGGHVGEQVAELGEPVGQPGRLRVVVADAVEQLAGRGDGAQGVRTAVVGGEAVARLLGGGAQRVGEPEPRLLLRQRDVLARLRRDTASISASPKRSRSASRARSMAEATTSASSASVAAQRGVGRGERAPQPQHLVAGEPVERLALGAGLQQPVLVGLPVHGDRGSVSSPRVAAGTDAPPTKARDRPSAETCRATSTEPSSTSPPSSSTRAASRPRRPHEALDPGLPGAGAHSAGVGPATHQQPERASRPSSCRHRSRR